MVASGQPLPRNKVKVVFFLCIRQQNTRMAAEMSVIRASTPVQFPQGSFQVTDAHRLLEVLHQHVMHCPNTIVTSQLPTHLCPSPAPPCLTCRMLSACEHIGHCRTPPLTPCSSNSSSTPSALSRFQPILPLNTTVCLTPCPPSG